MELAEIQDSGTDSRIAKFIFELPIEAVTENGDNMYFNIYGLGKNQLLGISSLYASTPASSSADMNPPELVSAEFSNYYDASFPQRDFIKIDVDGYENEVMSNIEEMITNSNDMKIALCTYHAQEDYSKYSKILKSFGFDVKHSKGYMIFYWDKNLKFPFLRRGLIRAKK